ncbi:enoyl-CoA hydratase/isomerase family protein [Pseudomonas sp. NFX15]|uniref:enoyl-CoA hydratase/isomerase family protein n=1 Tax=Pseudomonas sp. NFX15 TaxID=2816958 RepID=UPI003B8C75A8
MNNTVLMERRGAVALLTLNLPEKRNALAQNLVQELAAQLLALEDDRSCRAVVITGGRHFCAGGELDNLQCPSQLIRANMREGHRVIRQIVCGRLPVVAAVQGAAFGAGLSLASACDFVVASPASQFGAVFAKVGVMADWGLLWTLPHRIGNNRCKRMVMLTEVLNGSKARDIGLVDDLVETNDEILPHALELAQRLAAAAPGPLSGTKTLMARAMGLDALLDWEADTQALLISSEDFAEGRDAFFAKRTPEFSGR